MKKFGMMLLFIGFGIVAMAQTEKVTQEPEYTGGNEALVKHIKENLKYPDDAIKEATGGTVYAAITIDKDGKVRDAEVLRGVSATIDAEAIRVIKLMPNWIPGKDADGNPVIARVTLPIKFSAN